MANHDSHGSHSNSHTSSHANSQSDAQKLQEDNRIAKEMSPFLIYAALPILLIVFIALAYGPSY